MYWFITVAFLFGSLATGDARMCNSCMQITADPASYSPGQVDPNMPSCETPQSVQCNAGDNLCLAMTINVHYTTQSSDTVTFMQTMQGCMEANSGGPQIAPNSCASQEEFNTFAQGATAAIQAMMPPESGLTFDRLSGSVCTCDSDNCTPSPPASAGGGDAQPTAEPEGRAEPTMETTTKGAAPASAVGSMVLIIGSILSVLASYII